MMPFKNNYSGDNLLTQFLGRVHKGTSENYSEEAGLRSLEIYNYVERIYENHCGVLQKEAGGR